MPRKPKIKTDGELAWAAGFFCGEGCTYWRHGKPRANGREYGTSTLEIVQAGDPWVLEKFKHAIGNVGKIYGPYFHKGGRLGKQPYWLFLLGKRVQVDEVMLAMWPWLSPVKQDQYIKVRNKVIEDTKRPRLKTGPKPKGNRYEKAK